MDNIYVDLINGEIPAIPFATGKIFHFDLNIDKTKIPADQETPATDDNIDEKIASDNFITPSEYYNKNSEGTHGSAEKDKQGYYNANGTNTNIEIKWFWLEELKNWCTYTVSTNGHQALNIFTLSVWNGKNGWISISNETITKDPYSLTQDLFGIHKLQEPFLLDARGYYLSNNTFIQGTDKHVYTKLEPGKNDITQLRGLAQNTYSNNDGTTNVVSLLPYRLHHIRGFRLQKNTKYTINDQNNFQTIRWNTLYNPIVEEKTIKEYLGAYAQTNARYPVSTGIPTVWRLPSGDIFLATTFFWNADNGNAYYFAKDKGGPFRKKFYKTGNTPEFRMMGDNDFTAAAWLNSLCANYFGSGDNKTIENDWLREKPQATNDDTDYSVDYTNMLVTTKIFEQHNINKENSMKCSFVVHRPNVTTEEVQTIDYAKKW